MEARDEKRLLRLQAQLDAAKLLIVDELSYVPLSQTGAELLFEVFSRRHERASTLVTSNLPFDEWTGVFGDQRLTGALLDRLTHHAHILEMNGDSYRLKTSPPHWPEIPPPLTSIVRCRMRRSRVLCSTSTPCCSALFDGTKRIDGRETASQIASASAASFFWRFTNGFT